MKFFIIDDSLATRAMLAQIIESEQLGTIEGEAEDGIEINNEILLKKKIDILIIDLLMKKRDGIETIKSLLPRFQGKIIMISQIDQKDMIAEAYTLGIDHYITKPINKYEVMCVIKNVSNHYIQEKSLTNIRQALQSIQSSELEPSYDETPRSSIPKIQSIVISGKNILMELGIVGESGYYDLLNIIKILHEFETASKTRFQMPDLKYLFKKIAEKNCGSAAHDKKCIMKEAKATEQRIRRTIQHTLTNLASLGLTDFGNPIFERYANQFYDFTQVREEMLRLEGKTKGTTTHRLNIKKFIEVFYMEAKKDT